MIILSIFSLKNGKFVFTQTVPAQSINNQHRAEIHQADIKQLEVTVALSHIVLAWSKKWH